MKAHLPNTTTEVAGGIYDQNCVGRLVVNVECGLTSRHLAKRSCRWCDPVSGQCRHLCVPKPGRKIKQVRSFWVRFNSQHRP